MATAQKPLAFGTLNTIALTSVYTVPTGDKIQPFLLLTNASATQVNASIIINNGSVDLLASFIKIPAGVGKNIRALEVSDLRLQTGMIVKLQLSAAIDVNYFLSGVVIPDD